MAPLRLALIGAGRRGRGAHLPVIARMRDRFELVAVGDVDPEAARVAEEYGARAYTRLQELVRQERPEAAVVTVPLDGEMETEAAIHTRFRESYGREAEDVERLGEVFCPPNVFHGIRNAGETPIR